MRPNLCLDSGLVINCCILRLKIERFIVLRGTVIVSSVHGLKLFHEEESPHRCLPVWQRCCCCWSATFSRFRPLKTEAAYQCRPRYPGGIRIHLQSQIGWNKVIVTFGGRFQMGRGAPNLRPPHGGSSALRALLHKPGLLIKIYDAVEQTVLHVATPAGRGRGEVGEGRGEDTWGEENTWESVNRVQPLFHFCLVCLTALMVRYKDDLWRGTKQCLDAVSSFYDATCRRGHDVLMGPWCLSQCPAVNVVWKKQNI